MATNDAWLAGTIEATLDPKLPICDAHHHLWNFHADSVEECYLLDDFLRDTSSGHNIVSTVFIECGAMFKANGPTSMRPIGETEFANGLQYKRIWNTTELLLITPPPKKKSGGGGN